MGDVWGCCTDGEKRVSVGEVDVELGLEFEVEGLGAAELFEDAGEF